MPTETSGTAPGAPQAGGLVTVIGESLVDIISDPRRQGAEDETHPGGSPLNVAVGCARLDLRTRLVTHFADDPHGLLIADHLAGNGVEAIVDHAPPTSSALAVLDHDGAARYTFSIGWDIAGAYDRALASVQESIHVHAGSIAAVLPPGSELVLRLLEAARGHATVSFDPNCRPAISPDVSAARRRAEDFVAASDVVKASDEDLRWLYPDRSLDSSMEAWLGLGPSIVALTRGAAGPVLLSREGRVDLPGEAITVADTVGAGDSFMAGLISGLAQMDVVGAAGRERLCGLGADRLRALAAYANRAAAITCSRRGANPPRSAELGPLTGAGPS